MHEIQNFAIGAWVPVFNRIADVLKGSHTRSQSHFSVDIHSRIGDVNSCICVEDFRETSFLRNRRLRAQFFNALVTH